MKFNDGDTATGETKRDGLMAHCSVALLNLEFGLENPDCWPAANFAFRNAIREASEAFAAQAGWGSNVAFTSAECSKGGRLNRDHAVPVSLITSQIMALGHRSVGALKDLVARHTLFVQITEEEHTRLSRMGFKKLMPKDWRSGQCPLARYVASGIKLRAPRYANFHSCDTCRPIIENSMPTPVHQPEQL